jgi:hypothetical protein
MKKLSSLSLDESKEEEKAPLRAAS